jgi:hypothetical protein
MLNMLQTDSSFPRFATSGDPNELAQEESMFRENEVAEALVHYEDREITDSNGQLWRGPLTPVGIAPITNYRYWGFEVTPNGLLMEKPGTILKSGNTVSEQITIENIDLPLPVASGKVLYLKFEDIQEEQEKCYLKLDDVTGFTLPYEYEYDEETERWSPSVLRYPLWYFTDSSEGLNDFDSVESNVFAVRVAPDSSFRLISAVDTTHGAHLVPVLQPDIEALPEGYSA